MEITDYRPGIPAGLTNRIFMPRVRSTTEVAGTGLSLPIARGIAGASWNVVEEPEGIRGG